MSQETSMTFSQDEILYLLVISGAEDEEIFERFGLTSSLTTRESLEKGKESLLSRELISQGEKDDIPVIDDTVIALVGSVAVGTFDGLYYQEVQTQWQARVQKEGMWYVLSGSEMGDRSIS